jgi:hypothetical protein
LGLGRNVNRSTWSLMLPPSSAVIVAVVVMVAVADAIPVVVADEEDDDDPGGPVPTVAAIGAGNGRGCWCGRVDDVVDEGTTGVAPTDSLLLWLLSVMVVYDLYWVEK